jgi:Flp pilus assembly protein TadG
MEFAIAAPVLITLFLGTSEMSRYLLVHAKAEKVAYSLSDLISQSSQSALTTAEITQLMDAAAEVMSPFPFGTSGTVIISSIGKSGNNAPTVVWRSTGGGSLPASSQIGNVGATATLPYGFTMLASENVIVAEVYYSFTPMLGSQIVGNQTIYKTAYFKPRLGSLTNPPT